MKTMNAPNGPVPVSRTPVPIPIRRPSTGTPVAQSPVTKPATPVIAQNPAPIKAPPRLEPTPLPQPRHADQQIDAQYGKFVNRPGEVVWFRRHGGSAFGLGLVVRRWTSPTGNGQGNYSIQPLSYPGFTPAQEIVDSGLQNVKPWLAWSVPSCTFEYLRQNPNLAYRDVDWKLLASGRVGEGHAEVDASILMAKAIDITFTPFESVKTLSNNGLEERYWNGLYYGAEKIWRGEPVRLRLSPASDVLVVNEIVEKVFPANTNPPHTTSKLELRGDVYSYATIPAPNPKAPPALPPDNHLPIRMRQDMQWRNHTLLSAASELGYWKLISPNQRVAIEDVKGRWYETSIMFQQEFFEAIQQKGNVNGSWMNARGDATGMSKQPGILVPHRLAAFQDSIPDQLRLIDGFAPPSEQQPQTSAMQGVELDAGAARHSFSEDDFMNFEVQRFHFSDNNQPWQ